jgi:hypothetical protein
MKKIFLITLTLLSVAFFAKAQVVDLEKVAALKLVKDNRAAINLSQADVDNAIISSTYKNKFAGTTMVYLQQTYKSVPIYNQLLTLAFKDGKLVSNAGVFISNVEDIANVKSEIPVVKAEVALMAAIADRKLTTTEMPIAISSKENGRKLEFGKMGVANENITTTLMWFPSENGKKTLRLGWQVYIIQKTSSDYWLVNIDATDKSIIGVGNLTVYCNWDAPCSDDQHNHINANLAFNKEVKGDSYLNFNNASTINNQVVNSPALVNSASYRVIPYPAESPIHPGGTPALVTNPWSLSGAGNAATLLNWHSVGATNYDYTRGNNVWAQEDRNGNNGSAPIQNVSTTTPDPLTFDFVPDFTVDPTQTTPIPNQQFNTTNLFYWNNIIHDLTYQYGFDEASRNFQADNLGKGGISGDYVFADAQDGSGTNNANFSTPADGGNGRMQMFLWTAPNPDRDGDVDNGIIAHEYAHGISNRLTGTGSGCLGNAEQMGEGWSDYYSLMYTQNWSTSNLNTGFNSPRGIGTYAANQPITGAGIRTQRYCTDLAINNRSYAASISTSSHTRGEIWCATLWDMTWGIINQVGTINPNLFNAAGVGGNSIALKLVTEGMKLQPCSPGFISGRDAILQADQILYGGAYRCTILEAFRRRGMGLGASQGSSASVTDQIPSFTNGGAGIVLLQGGITAVPEGQNITYTNRVTADVCSAFTNYTITDTLPANVTYVSGGTYNAANRVVSFSVSQAAGTTVDYSFVVNVNAGTYFAPATLLNEPVPAVLPSTWTATTTVPAGGNLWAISSLQSNSAPNAFFSENEGISTDKRLELTTGIAIPTGASVYPKLSFAHRYNTEDGWDGGVVEISTNGGTTWTDLGANMLTNKYNGTLGAGAGNNLSNRAAFTGSVPAFINTSINLSAYNGQTAKIRFRFASDDNTAGTGTPTGWFVDDINITNAATVSMRSSFFNASAVRVAVSDTVTLILPGAVSPPVITPQPSATSVCSGANATFTSGATGIGVTYSWEVSTNAGVSWSPISPAVTTATLTLTAVTVGMNNNLYRLVATNTAGSATSTSGLLTVTASPTAPLVSSPIAYCQGATASVLTATGTNLLWYTTATGGTGTTTAPTASTTAGGSTIYYVSQSVGICESPRAAITVNVTATPTTPIVATPVSYCLNTPAVPLTATGTNLLWYTAATGGTGSTTAPTPLTTTIGSTTYYVSQSASGGCEGPRAAITVNISLIPAAPGVTTPIAYCQGATATALTASGTNLLWYVAATGGTGSTAAPTPATTTVGSVTYYVSQSSSCGESPRAAIVVNTNTTPAAPTATSPITYCQFATATALTATGTNLLWYTTATGGTGSATAPTPATTTPGTTTYYVSQTTGVCEGPRRAIIVNVTATPIAPTVVTPVVYCQGTTAVPLTATGTNLLWYANATGGIGSATAPTPSTTSVGTTNYYVTQTISSCESPRALIAVTINVTPAAPIVSSTVVYCQGETATALTAIGTNIKWYSTATGGTALPAAPTPSTSATGSTTYYVSQTIGTCEGPRAAIVVNVNITPSAPTVTTPISLCQGSPATALTATGTNLIWYTTATGGSGSSIAPSPVTTTVGSTSYYVSQTVGVCEGPRAVIVVNISAAPSITSQPQDITTCGTSATFTATASGTALTYQWQLSIDGGTTYTNIIGATSNVLTLTNLSAAQGNYKYRMLATSGTCTVAITNSVTAKVGVTPVVVLTTAPVANFNPYTNGGLYTTVSPVGNYTYQWKRNNVNLTNTGTFITKANGLLDDFGSYVVTVTDPVTGCIGFSNAVSVSDIEGTRNQLFVSPNPTTGLFRVSFYSSTTTTQNYSVNVHDEKGARVMVKAITLTGRYGSANVDLTTFASGTYIVILRDASGNKVASNKVVKY